jgi:hypothetical protein
MSEETPVYITSKQSFEGMSEKLNGPNSPAAWKDIFVFNDDCGRAHIAPCDNVILSEVSSDEWVFRTAGGDFKPIANDPILDMIMDGVREFAVVATSYSVELQKGREG